MKTLFLTSLFLGTFFINEIHAQGNELNYDPIDLSNPYNKWPPYHDDGVNDSRGDIKPHDLARFEPISIDISWQDFYVDLLYNKFYGAIHVYGDVFQDTIWTCYEFFFDKDTSLGVTDGDPDNPWYHNVPTSSLYFTPDYRFRFCGKNNQLIEERFQYWDGERWIGEPVTDDPRLKYHILYAVPGGKTAINFEFYNLDSLCIHPPIPAKHPTKMVKGATRSTQGEFYDLIGAFGMADIGQYSLKTKQKHWQELKEQHIEE